MTKVVSAMTVKEHLKTSQGTQDKGTSNYVGRQQQPQLTHGADGMLEPNITCFCCKDTRHTKNNCVRLNNKIMCELQAQEQVTNSKATCPRVNMGCGRKRIPSMLDSGSQVTLICQSYFKWEILPHIRPSGGEKAEAHQLTAANHGQLPMSMYVELDLDFFGDCCAKSWGSYYPRAQ